MIKRIIAAFAVLAIWIALVWFTAWDRSPATWTPDIRFVVAMVGLFFAGTAASCPLFDEY